jgi:hypothetical protein
VATKFDKLEDHEKRGVELKHCITSSSKQFSGKIKKSQFEICTKFYVIEFSRVSTKKFTIPKSIVFHKISCRALNNWKELFSRK